MRKRKAGYFQFPSRMNGAQKNGCDQSETAVLGCWLNRPMKQMRSKNVVPLLATDVWRRVSWAARSASSLLRPDGLLSQTVHRLHQCGRGVVIDAP